MAQNLRLVGGGAPELASPAEFTEAMSEHASGVVVVTSRVDERPWGTTVTAFAPVSADPPTVLVSLRSDGVAARAIAATGRFGISLLAEPQLAVARHGAAPRAAKFLEPFAAPGGLDRSPVVVGALAHLDCELHERVEVADHTVFFGRVQSARVSPSGAPLVYHRRDYRTLADPDPQPLTERSERWLAN